VEFAEWNNFSQVKLIYPSADQLSDNSVLFNVKGNQHILVIFSFTYQLVQRKWFGRHKDYDSIDALIIQPEF
jgi:mRNA interferase HigB